jgi:hypothetical protein
VAQIRKGCKCQIEEEGTTNVVDYVPVCCWLVLSGKSINR